MRLVGEALGLLDVVPAHDFIDLCIVGEINGQVARGTCMIEIGLSGNLIRVMPPTADELALIRDFLSLSVDGEGGTFPRDAHLVAQRMGRSYGCTCSEKRADTARDDSLLHVSSDILFERNWKSFFNDRKSVKGGTRVRIKMATKLGKQLGF